MVAPAMPTQPDSAPSREAETLVSEEALFELFANAFRPDGRLVGIESEKVALYSDGAPLHYADAPGRPGVAAIFAELAARYGWSPEADKPGGPALMLVRGRANITLEPGSQFELSGSPLGSAHHVRAELDAHAAELASLESTAGLHFLGVGFHPYAKQSDLDWVPKSRYPIMREYLPTRGASGLDMMRRTATVQANFDFGSERDAMRKLRCGLALSPMVSALFANSPLVEGAWSGLRARRLAVWLEMDPDRSGLLPFAWSRDASLGDYIRWAKRAPMFIVKRGAEVLPATHLSFERFMAEGLGGHRAVASDWESHLKTMFPEVRLARTLEVRGADSAPRAYATAMVALWLGVLYDDDCLDWIDTHLVSRGYAFWQGLRPEIAARALATRFDDGTLGDVWARFLPVVEAALARRNKRDLGGLDERSLLAPAADLIERRQSVGERLLEGWSPERPSALSEFLRRMAF